MIENDDKRLPVPEAAQRNRPDTADRFFSLSLSLTLYCLSSPFFGLEHQTHTVISCIYKRSPHCASVYRPDSAISRETAGRFPTPYSSHPIGSFPRWAVMIKQQKNRQSHSINEMAHNSDGVSRAISTLDDTKHIIKV